MNWITLVDPLLVQLLAGAGLGLLAQRLGIPVLVGFIVAGAGLAVAGLSQQTYLTELAELGVLLLLFTVGLHLRVADLIRREVLATGLLHWSVGAAVFVGIAVTLGIELHQAIVLGAILGFSSTVLAAQELDRSREVTAFHGRIAISILILQDLIAVFLLVWLSPDSGHESGLTRILLHVGFAVCSLFIAMRSRERVLRLVSFVIVAVAVAELFEVIGLGRELGAFAGGLVAARIRGHEEIADGLWGLKEYFLIGFFLSVGMGMTADPAALLLSLPLLAILPAKIAFLFVLFVLFGLRARTAFLSGALLTSYSEFALIAGAVALSAGLIEPLWMNAITVAVVASFVLYLPISRMNNLLYERVEPFLLGMQRSVTRADPSVGNLGGAEYLVIGLGRCGRAAQALLRERQQQVVGMDADPWSVRDLVASGQEVVLGDALDRQLWSTLELQRLRGIVVALPGADARLRCIRLLRETGFGGRVSSFGLDEEEVSNLAAAGADSVASLLVDSGERIAEQVLIQD